MEVWKYIEWTDNQYMISSYWRLKNMYTRYKWNIQKRERILKLSKIPQWYLRAEFQWKREYVHRLVWLHFLDKWDFKEINHEDGNKENNHVSNLKWCNRSYNINHRNNILWYKNKNPYKHKKIIVKSVCWKFNKTFKCLQDASDYLNIPKSTLFWNMEWTTKYSKYKDMLIEVVSL